MTKQSPPPNREKRFPIKKIKELIERIYTKGVYDGFDIIKRPHDRFLGNQIARYQYEKVFRRNFYKELRKML